MKTAAYLHPSHDGLVTTDNLVYEKPRELVLRSEAEDLIRAATLEATAALEYVDRVCRNDYTEVTYETLQRSGFKRKEGWRRKYTLSDARKDAKTAAIRLRNAWEILDPSTPR